MSDDSSLIHAHHIGGRDGGTKFPALRAFKDDFILYSYDADEDCEAQMANILSSTGFTARTQSALIGASDGPAEFFLNRDPYTSSLLPPNPDHLDLYYFDDSYGDYLMRDTLQTVEKRVLHMQRLDTLVEEQGLNVDFLSLDVQGAEYALLSGGGETLRRQVVGLVQEAVLVDLYKGQGSLGEVLGQAEESGFRLIGFEPQTEFSRFRAPMGWRHRGATTVVDLNFLKDPRLVAEHHAAPLNALFKLAAVALFFGQIELMLECGTVAREAGLSFERPPSGERRYQRLVSELWCGFNDAKQFYPPSFTELFSEEESLARFSPDRAVSDIRNIDHTILRHRYFDKYAAAPFLANCELALGATAYGAEKVLQDFGMLRSANEVRSRTTHEVRRTLVMLGLLAHDDADPDWDAIKGLLVTEFPASDWE